MFMTCAVSDRLVAVAPSPYRPDSCPGARRIFAHRITPEHYTNERNYLKMDHTLAGSAVAIMVASGFEETELTEPQRALLKTGANLKTISPDQGLVNGWHGHGWGHFFPIDRQIGEVLGADYDMLLLPGGERSVGKLRLNPHTKRIVGHFLDAGKPIAAIGQGVSLLPVARKLKGRILRHRSV